MSFKNDSDDKLKSDHLLLKNRRETVQDAVLLREIDSALGNIEAELNQRHPARPQTVAGFGGDSAPKTKLYGMTAEGTRIPIYSRDERMAPENSEGEGWLSSFVRNSMGIGGKSIQNLDSGAATVPVSVSLRIFDAARAKARLIQAGSLVIPVSGPTNFIKITADATVSQHAEGTDDISESAPTFGTVQGNPETLACLVPLSMELVADSPNLDAALNTALSGAFATKLDALGIATLLADGNLNESASSEDTETWGGTMTAVGAALAADMDTPGALICSPADWAARNGQRWDSIQASDGLGAWLGAPAVLQGMLDLPTSSMTAGHALFGDFSKGCAVIVRQDLRLEVIRWAKPGYGTHLLAAYVRAQAYSTQPKALYHQIKTVV